MSSERIDLGDDHELRWLMWDPDLTLNPKWRHLKDQLPARVGAIVSHKKADGSRCEGTIHFASDLQREAWPSVVTWALVTESPLTLSPSLLCQCGDHGYVRDGRWVRA